MLERNIRLLLTDNFIVFRPIVPVLRRIISELTVLPILSMIVVVIMQVMLLGIICILCSIIKLNKLYHHLQLITRLQQTAFNINNL